MNKEALIVGHEAKKTLLKEVIKRKIWQIKPKTLSVDEWSMQRKIGFQYTFTDKTYEELGEQYGGRSREDMRQLNHKFLDNIHRNLPYELQAQYPRESIPDRKPETQGSRERRSAIRNELSIKIKEIALGKEGEQGITDPKEIALRLKVSESAVSNRRKTLESWGVPIDRHNLSYYNFYSDLVKKVENENNDKKLEQILDDLPVQTIIDFLTNHKDGAIRTVSKVIRGDGFHPNNKDIQEYFIKAIRKAGIPVRRASKGDKRNYWVIFSKHTDRTIEALNKDSALERFRKNPISLAFGTFDGKSPTTTQLKRKQEYGNAGELVYEVINYRIGRNSKLKYADFFNSSPVPIFTYQGRYYYSLEKKRVFEEFLLEKYSQIRLRTS